MDDIILRYYEAEMRYLREAGKEFAQAHPDRARLLNMDRVGDRDPYVERLYEGFAFLTARIRQKLDDELPELTEGLVGLLWPHYLRMIPSLSMVELVPSAELTRPTTIDAGLALRSRPMGHAGTRCLYRTTGAVMLRPLRLTAASSGVQADGRSVILLRFDIEAQARREDFGRGPVRLYLDADLPVACALHLALTAHVASVRVRIPGDSASAALPSTSLRFVAAGFDPVDRLWPKAETAFAGYQLLLEYFTFREKFLFVDIEGLDLAELPATASSFEIEVALTHDYPAGFAFDARNVRLHCTPVINLFEIEPAPLHVDHHETDYRVVPPAHLGEHVEIYTVDSVQSYDHRAATRHDYVAFSSFRHRGGMLRHDAPERYFHTRVRQGVRGLHDTWLVLGGHAWDADEPVPAETLSLRATGTHGLMPRKGLRESRIDELVIAIPAIGSIRQCVAPTMPLYPPVNDRFHWRVLSHLAPNFLSLLDAEVLRGALALYDWTDDELNRRRLAGIVQIRHALCEQWRRGGLERGVRIEVTLDGHAFAGPGDVRLFGELLHRFFALYAEVNVFTQLRIVVQPDDTVIDWPRSEDAKVPL